MTPGVGRGGFVLPRSRLVARRYRLVARHWRLLARRRVRVPAHVSRFSLGLTLITLLGVVIRVVQARYIAPATHGLSDSIWYRTVGLEVSQGHGFVMPLFLPHRLLLVRTAAHPPLYTVVIAVARKLGIASDVSLRSLGALFGAVQVAGLGLLARKLGGVRLGLITAGLVAVDPLLIAADGALMSETVYGAVLVVLLLAAWRLNETHTIAAAAAVGALIGLATLTRSEAILLVLILALPLALRGSRQHRWQRVAAVLAATAVVLAPWVGRNWSVFGHPLLSTNFGATIEYANCHTTYHGNLIGLTGCPGIPVHGNEAQKDSQSLHQGVSYAEAHPARAVLVAVVRLLRSWSFYRPFQSPGDQGRNTSVQEAGIVFYYVLLLPAIAGFLALWRRRGQLWRRRAQLLIVVSPAILASLIAMATYGSLRMRYAGELSLLLLAGAGIEWGLLQARYRGWAPSWRPLARPQRAAS